MSLSEIAAVNRQFEDAARKEIWTDSLRSTPPTPSRFRLTAQ